MKLYRLYKGCDGEYACDYYLGLFKTTDAMISFVKNYIRTEYRWHSDDNFDGLSISLDKERELSFSGAEAEYNNWLLGDIEYEIIDTDTLV